MLWNNRGWGQLYGSGVEDGSLGGWGWWGWKVVGRVVGKG